MRSPLTWFRRTRPRPPDESPEGPDSIRSRFHKFRRILDLNTRVLERMATMERAQGGEYIFDRAFLDSSIRELGTLVHQVVYSLNSLSGDHYVALYDSFQSVQSILEDILSGGLGPQSRRLTLPLSEIGWESEPLVGIENACLGELGRNVRLPVADGFVVTVAGCRRLLGEADPGPTDTPDDLRQAVQTELAALFSRRGGPCPLTIAVCPAGSAGEPEESVPATGHDGVEPEAVWDGLRTALARTKPAGDVALRVSAAVVARLAGTVRTLDRGRSILDARPDLTPDSMAVSAVVPGKPAMEERYLLRRAFPFDLVGSEIATKPTSATLPDGLGSLTPLPSGLRRGSALLPPSGLRALAEAAMTVERAMGSPQEIGWVQDKTARPLVMSIRPLRTTPEKPGSPGPEDDAAQLGLALAAAPVLAKGGGTAQGGVAAGRIVHVREENDPESFPAGAVAVARTASPRLSPVLRKATAMVTEVGSPAGHLATIARELRVPALFGVPEAMLRLPQCLEATVDAGERIVYGGIVEPLLRFAASGMELTPSDPEYVTLRRLLRFILPLNLTDPAAPGFSPQGCRTYHDIIHFAHERSVEELLRLQDERQPMRGYSAKRLALDVPLDIRIMDLGGGLRETAGDPAVPDEVLSEPLAAFLRGLEDKSTWNVSPAPIGLRDIFSSLARPVDNDGVNLALVARGYLNLSLRLGYHFSVIDAYLGGDLNNNYVYFRFAGGLADDARRQRRAKLVRIVLESLDFHVTVKGDLVTGKLKIAPAPDMDRALSCLGRLTGFTRQLDVSMASDEDVERLTEEFLSLVRRDAREPAREAGEQTP